jgi:hypothetical protein
MATTFKRWTTLEVDMMIECLKKKKTFEYISTRIERSTYAIKCKFETYVFDKVNSGVSYEDLTKEFGLSESKLKEFYQIQLQRHNEKNKKDIVETKPNKPTKTIKKDSNKSENKSKQTKNSDQLKNFDQSILNIPNITQNILSNNINQFNMILDPYITFYENIERLKKISTKIPKITYDEIINIIDQSKIDDTQILNDLKRINLQKKIPIKSSSETDISESDNESESDDDDDDDDNNLDSNSNTNSKSNLFAISLKENPVCSRKKIF